MKRPLKQIVIFLSLLLLLNLTRLVYGSYTERTLALLKDNLKPAGVNVLGLEEANLSFPLEFAIKGLTLSFPTKMGLALPLRVDSLQSDNSVLNLLRGKLNSDISGQLYQGKLNITNSYTISQKLVSGQLQLTDLSLSAHPNLALLGVGGKVAADSEFQAELKDNRAALSSARGTLNISEAFFQSRFKLYGLLAIPEVKDLKAKVNFSYQASALNLTDLDLTCSLGKIFGQAKLRGTQLSDGAFNFDLTLSEEGKKVLAPYLQTFSGAVSTKTYGEKWEISGELTNGKLNVKKPKAL